MVKSFFFCPFTFIHSSSPCRYPQLEPRLRYCALCNNQICHLQAFASGTIALVRSSSNLFYYFSFFILLINIQTKGIYPQANMGKKTTKVGAQTASTAGECTDSKDSYIVPLSSVFNHGEGQKTKN